MKPHVAPRGEERTDELAEGLTPRPGSCTGAEAKGCPSGISWQELDLMTTSLVLFLNELRSWNSNSIRIKKLFPKQRKKSKKLQGLPTI